MVWMSVYAMSECGCGLMWSDVLHDGSMRGAHEGHRKHLVGSGMKPRMCSCQFWYSSMRLHSSVCTCCLRYCYKLVWVLNMFMGKRQDETCLLKT
jgi:hypothetical protein